MLATFYFVLCDVLLIMTKLCLIIHVIHMFLSIYNRASVLSPCNQEIGLKALSHLILVLSMSFGMKM